MKLFELMDKASHLQVVLPWFYRTADASLGGLRRDMSQRRLHWIHSTIRMLVWLPACTLLAIRIVFVHGKPVARECGLTRSRFFTRLIGAACLDNVPPGDSLRLRLYRRSVRESKAAWVLQREKAAFFDLLKPAMEHVIGLNHKMKFYRVCQRYSLPTPAPVFASQYENVQEKWFCEQKSLPRVDLFRKSITGFGGDGARLYKYRGSEDRWQCDDRVLGEEELIADVRGGGYVLQCREQNHPSISDLGAEGLCTLRCVTLRNPDGDVSVFAAILRMPTGSMVVDHLTAGGVGALVDTETGVLSAGFSKTRPWDNKIATHPDSGGSITGRLLEWWPEAKALCIRAHTAFPELPSIGWDLACTQRGLTLLEGNSGWNLELVQMATDTALLDGPVLDWYQNWRAQRSGRLA